MLGQQLCDPPKQPLCRSSSMQIAIIAAFGVVDVVKFDEVPTDPARAKRYSHA
jgi:hypothetical protein